MGCTTTVIPSSSGRRVGTGRWAAMAEHRRQVAAAEAVHQVVHRREAGVEHQVGRREQLGGQHARTQQRDDRGQRGIGRVVQVAVERCRLRVDGHRPQQLPRVVGAPRRAQLEDHHRPGLEPPRRRPLSRCAPVRSRHRRRRDVVDVVGAARPGVGTLDRSDQVELGRTRHSSLDQGSTRGVGQRSRMPQHRQLVGRLVQPCGDVRLLHRHQLDALGERDPQPVRHRLRRRRRVARERPTTGAGRRARSRPSTHRHPRRRSPVRPGGRWAGGWGSRRAGSGVRRGAARRPPRGSPASRSATGPRCRCGWRRGRRRRPARAGRPRRAGAPGGPPARRPGPGRAAPRGSGGAASRSRRGGRRR